MKRKGKPLDTKPNIWKQIFQNVIVWKCSSFAVRCYFLQDTATLFQKQKSVACCAFPTAWSDCPWRWSPLIRSERLWKTPWKRCWPCARSAFWQNRWRVERTWRSSPCPWWPSGSTSDSAASWRCIPTSIHFRTDSTLGLLRSQPSASAISCLSRWWNTRLKKKKLRGKRWY